MDTRTADAVDRIRTNLDISSDRARELGHHTGAYLPMAGTRPTGTSTRRSRLSSGQVSNE